MHSTSCAQQCCDMLCWHVAIVWPGLKSLLGIERQKKLEKFAILTRKPRSHAWILIHRTWPIYCVQLCFVCKGERQRLLKRKLAEYEEQLKKGSESYENLKREVEEQLQTQQQLQDNMLAGLIVGFVILVMICMLPRTLLASGWSAFWDFLFLDNGR